MSLKPCVSSTGVVESLLPCLMENFPMVCVRSLASKGCDCVRVGKTLVPEHDVRIRVLNGLTKHPRGRPSFSISVQKKLTSSSGTVDEMSSM